MIACKLQKVSTLVKCMSDICQLQNVLTKQQLSQLLKDNINIPNATVTTRVKLQCHTYTRCSKMEQQSCMASNSNSDPLQLLPNSAGAAQTSHPVPGKDF